MKRNITKLFLGVLLCCCCLSAKSQTSKQTQLSEINSPWYIGIKGGLPFGVCTFSSFAENKTRLGYDIGIYGGYNINSIFSVETFLMHGQIDMSSRGGNDYWLGQDGAFYYTPVSEMEGSLYSKLRSTATITRIGFQGNMDFLHFLSKNKNTRWKLYVSPAISAVKTCGTVKTINGNEKIFKGSNDLQLGLGGDISAAYQLTRHISAQIYTGITWLTNKRIDAMPKHQYSDNRIIESGIKLSWTFVKKGTK